MDIRNLKEAELSLIDMLITMKLNEPLNISAAPSYNNIVECVKALNNNLLLRDVFEREVELNNKETKLRVSRTPEEFLPPLFGSKNRFKDNENIMKPQATQEYINLILDKIEQAQAIIPEKEYPF